MSKSASTPPARRHRDDDSRPISLTPVPSSPSPSRGKRPQVGQPLHGRLPLMKKLKAEKEVTLHVLLPNATSVKFNVDPAKTHSFQVLLDLVKANAVDRQLEPAATFGPPRPVEWGDVKLKDVLGEVMDDTSVRRVMTTAKMGSTNKILVEDGHERSLHSDPDLWNVTPKPEMLGSLPQGYKLETALADQVDNALQAVWNNPEGFDRLVSVNLSRDKITIFDTGQGMDASSENYIQNWGTVGGSRHREDHHKALGGKAPFLSPYFGKYGAGGVAASLHLGGRVTVSSKTRQSNLVTSLVLEQEELVRRQQEESEQGVWKTPGEFRSMTKKEREMSPHCSFTKVEITKLKQQYCLDNKHHYWDVDNVCKVLKDIYFPYIQTEEGSKTVFPVEFKVNGKSLREVDGCETAVLKLHTSHGDPFEFDVHLTQEMHRDEGDKVKGKPMNASTVEEAKARITCYYYPNLKGQEALEAAAEQIKRLNHSSSMTFDNMNRVAIRWLGRLLPEVKWPVFPFMEVPLKKENRSGLQVWSRRVIAFVDTDAGFHPVQAKTELDRGQPFVSALKQIGSTSFDKTLAAGVKITIKRVNSLPYLKPSQLSEDYCEWVTKMHTQFDEEFVSADDDEPKYIFNHRKCLQDLGVGNCMILHTHMKDSKQDWKIDNANPLYFKLSKGPGLKAAKYVTVEHFFNGASEDGPCAQVKFLCRGIELDASEGCEISSLQDGSLFFTLKGSEWFPAPLLNTAKRLDLAAWKKKKEEISNKLPDFVEILKGEDAKTFEMCGAFPTSKSRFEAGYSLPNDFLVVVRPRNGSGPMFKQGRIASVPLGINLEVRHCTCPSVQACKKRLAVKGKEVCPKGVSLSETKDDHSRVICKIKAKSTSKNGVKGLYVFSTESTEINPLLMQGTYVFRFTVESDKYKDVRPAVSSIEIIPATTTAKWTLCNHPDHCTISQHASRKDDKQPIIRLNEPIQEDLFLQKYDQFGNSQVFEAPMELEITCVTIEGEPLDMHTKVQSSEVAGNQKGQRLLIQKFLFPHGSLKESESRHEALLRVCLADEQQADIRCKVLPGALATVAVTSSDPPIVMESMWFLDHLHPGEVIRNLALQGLDKFGNKIDKGQKLHIVLEGVEFQDDYGNDRVADENGTFQLGGLLKVACQYNCRGSISFHSGSGFISAINFATVRRRLVADQVPTEAYVGRQVEGISIRMVDEKGNVDESVNGYTQPISVDWLNGVTYLFVKGKCILPSFLMPEKPGPWRGIVTFSPDLNLSVTLTIQLKLKTASSLGSSRENHKILAAECGLPFFLPFNVYDEQHMPALLADSLKRSIKFTIEAKDTDNDSLSVFRSNAMDCKDVKMSTVDGIPTYEAQIVVSKPAGMYLMTLTDTSGSLDGKAQWLCKLQHGVIAQLVIMASDGSILQSCEKSAVSVIEAKRLGPIPELDVKLLDSVGNVCIGCDGRNVRVILPEYPDWKPPVTEIKQGTGKLNFSALDVPVGRYQGSIVLDSSDDETHALEEPTRCIEAQFSLRVHHGNYPAGLRLLFPDTACRLPLTDEVIQYLPTFSVLIESADAQRLQSSPTVGVKLSGEGFLASGPKEYFGSVVGSSDKDMNSLTSLKGDQGLSHDPTLTRYEFTQVCTPSQAGIYHMEFHVLNSNIPSQHRVLLVRHGPPKRILIEPRLAGQEIKVLKVNIVDAHGNLCENLSGRQVFVELNLNKPFTVTPVLSPCTIVSKRTTLVENGKGDFGVLQLSQGNEGLYSLKVIPVHDEGVVSFQSLMPVEAKVDVIRGKPSQPLEQLLREQYRLCQVNDDSGNGIAKCKTEVQVKQAKLRDFENQRKNLEADLVTRERRKHELDALQLAADDARILDAEMNQPRRHEQSVVQDLRLLAQSNNTAPLAFWEALSDMGRFSPQQLADFVGLVVMLARVESDSLNRMIAEFLGLGTLCLIVTRTQLGINALEVHDTYGQVDENKGLHAVAHSLGCNMPNKFEVLALSDITSTIRPQNRRPAVNMEHHQRLLCIDPPTLPQSTQVPEGFLGYAVNLLYLKPEHLQMRVNTKTQSNVGLRESLWFHLLKFLQVYDTRANMISAKERLGYLGGGAISLDGGVIRANSRQQLGRRRTTVPLCFSLVPFEERRTFGSLMPLAGMAIERQRESITLEKLITSRRDVLNSLIPKRNAANERLKELKRHLHDQQQQERETQKSSKEIRDQIAEVQRAAQRAAKDGGMKEDDRTDSQGGDGEKMRIFMMSNMYKP